jgi:DNA-binding transcriptional MerR regulator
MEKKKGLDRPLPDIPAKLYFTIGEVSDLCRVKTHVLRYWEQVFPELKPKKRRGNRRYYSTQDILLVRQIRELLYLQGFTINGAKQALKQGISKQKKHDENQDVISSLIDELNQVLESLV